MSKKKIASALILAGIAASFVSAFHQMTKPPLTLSKKTYTQYTQGEDARLVPLAEQVGLKGLRFLDRLEVPIYEIRKAEAGDTRIDFHGSLDFGFVCLSEEGTEITIVKDGQATTLVCLNDGQTDTYIRSFNHMTGIGRDVHRPWSVLIPGNNLLIKDRVKAVRQAIEKGFSDKLLPKL